MELTELPFTTTGRVFRSAMPFSGYDPDGELITAYKQRDISMVIMLSSDEENYRIAGQDLKSFYERQGFDVISLPIRDFSTPNMAALRETVRDALDYSQSGKGMVIHCHAGIGRTGMFAACMAKEGLDYSSDEAIDWIREYIPGAIEVPEQELIIRSY